MENKVIFDAILEDMVSLDNNDAAPNEAFASLSSNPSVNWIKFTLVDDKPNGNKQRVPKEEFPNIINSGIFMPIKKAIGKIEKGHENSVPIGVISHLKQVDDKIKGIATLWSKERPKDVEQIKNELKSGKPINLSWELTYDVEASEKEGDITTFKNVFLTAATIVGRPSYKGRTSVEAFAADNDSGKEDEMAGEDESKELEKLQKKYEELKTKYDELNVLSTTKDGELTVLKNFKAEFDKVEAERKKLTTIKQKFTIAKIEKDDKYFDENKEKLLELDENTLEFLLQDLKVFEKQDKKEDNPNTDKSKVPNILGKQITDLTPKSIGEALREMSKPQPLQGK